MKEKNVYKRIIGKNDGEEELYGKNEREKKIMCVLMYIVLWVKE